MKCQICPHHCELEEGKIGRCRVRTIKDGSPASLSYGVLSSIALDPIEKKPLRRFHPGSLILSVGSFGCNLSCPFCQNHSIAQRGVPASDCEENMLSAGKYESLSPQELAGIAIQTRKDSGNIGIAYTYNEPLICFEYVRETAALIHSAGMYNVLVTNGCVLDPVLAEVLPLTDAMNIDLKAFT
ncbi:MAG: radical SAM protein, partial [Lachnospiraceae bacterium]|nr:radical SAM protein [Lachnospiraceae bacterium]